MLVIAAGSEPERQKKEKHEIERKKNVRKMES